MPRPLGRNYWAVKFNVGSAGTEKSLPLEGKVVRLKPDRMRSKVAILCHPMVIIFSFDLISRN